MTTKLTPEQAHNIIKAAVHETIGTGVEGMAFSAINEAVGARVHINVNVRAPDLESILFHLLIHFIDRDEATRDACISALRAVFGEIAQRGLCNCPTCRERKTGRTSSNPSSCLH